MIKDSEIDSIEEIGRLSGRPVKLIRTLGGFYIAIGSPNGREEALAAGSHPAIVKFNLKKKYSNIHFSFHKSEHKPEPTIKDYTNLLPKPLVNKGFSFYSVSDLSKTEFYLNKYCHELLKMSVQGTSVNSLVNGNIDKKTIEIIKDIVKKEILGE